jgi:hypothetical protein
MPAGFWNFNGVVPHANECYRETGLFFYELVIKRFLIVIY